MQQSKTEQPALNKRQILGKVVSTSMQKSVVVEVAKQHTHPLYGKTIRRTKRYLVHNENAEVKVGTSVWIIESKPISKKKRFTVLSIA